MTKLASLRRSAEFSRAFKEGTRLRSNSLQVVVFERGEGPPRVGVVVPRRLGGAVVRNRVKRRVRSILRASAGKLVPGVDYVVMVNRQESFQRMNEEVSRLLTGGAEAKR